MKYIILTNNKKTLLDNEDYKRFCKYKWGTLGYKFIYASRGTRFKGVYKKILLHREIMKASKGEIVDHINGNTLDNRKCNLRITNRAGNTRNSKIRSDSKTGYKGVSKKDKKFCARIQISYKKRLFLGYFLNKLDAAKAYNEAAKKYFGSFAKLNKGI